MMAPKENQKGTLIAVTGIILAGGVAGFLLGRVDAESPVAPVAVATPARESAASEPAARTPAVIPAAPVPATLSDADLAKLAEASMAGPRGTRLAAIQRLSQAPRDQALPLLKRALLNGEPGVDRPAALLGLQELALAQGDGDERIRDVVREVIYHGDDDAFAADAQAALDTIAASESR